MAGESTEEATTAGQLCVFFVVAYAFVLCFHFISWDFFFVHVHFGRCRCPCNVHKTKLSLSIHWKLWRKAAWCTLKKIIVDFRTMHRMKRKKIHTCRKFRNWQRKRRRRAIKVIVIFMNYISTNFWWSVDRLNSMCQRIHRNYQPIKYHIFITRAIALNVPVHRDQFDNQNIVVTLKPAM